MGNLPRSRPGRRSEKRSSASKPSQKGTAKRGASASRSGAPGKGSATSSARSAGRATRARSAGGATRGAGSRTTSGGGAQAARGPDPVGDAVRIAAKVAGTGMGIAAGILKRLPRP